MSNRTSLEQGEGGGGGRRREEEEEEEEGGRVKWDSACAYPHHKYHIRECL